MAVAQSKNISEIKKIVYEQPDKWTAHKESGNAWTGYKNTNTSSLKVTIKWKDGSPDQEHNIPDNGTVLFSSGMVHLSA